MQTLVELIDMRSFSNLWYWIALAVTWSMASHWVIGVPYDLIVRARRRGGDTLDDLHDILRVNIHRLLAISDGAGPWLLAMACFVLTGLATLAFLYRIEFAQAVFLIAFPITLVGAMTIRTARRIMADEPEDDVLFRTLARHRFGVQLLGLVSILVTAMYGMYQNLAVGPFGS